MNNNVNNTTEKFGANKDETSSSDKSIKRIKESYHKNEAQVDKKGEAE
ncbi:hypothetical protein LI147_06230 [Blautia wexlerae]|nr:hypothetical protein [Blautia wexlerae]MCB6686549.1 hypothetical protein [Blautia wexlerae]